MNNTLNNTFKTQQTVSATEIRFNLGKILNNLERSGEPFIIISRSKPKAWLYPYEPKITHQDFFMKWQKEIYPKYKKIKAKKMIALIRKERER